MKPNELILEWHAGIRINVLAHYDCAKLYENQHRLLGYPTVILSALTGTTYVSTLNDSADDWARSVAVVLSLAVTVLVSLQTFLRYAERAEKHKEAATEFGKLRRELEEIIAYVPENGKISVGQMEMIRAKWGELSTHAPSIPNKIYTRMFCKVWHKPDGTEKGMVPPAPTAP